ncbi:phosphatase [Ruminococcus sp. OA3]|uniref:phosphatase n=1 Tax=Ruminococcus sp. OA3 TaxID=2914164 RepID=UPI001F061A7D|nr:phosphatase [Ruminococcus sp. OA3]MCH1982871.1 phosphatase [Ruminococcus sp. OA3]
MKDVLDAHTHTIVSGHAYNTMTEMMQAAAEKNLELLAITDHAPAMPGSTHPYYFSNSDMIDREYYHEKFGKITRYLIGVELNILPGGDIDLGPKELAKMDVAIASIHPPCYPCGDIVENTRAYLRVMEHPYINIIGHPDDGRFPVHMEALVEGARKHGKVLELNNHSLDSRTTRRGARDIDRGMLLLCKKYGQPVIVNSDAHTDTEIGNHAAAFQLIEETGFPADLVLNTSVSLFLKYTNLSHKNA